MAGRGQQGGDDGAGEDDCDVCIGGGGQALPGARLKYLNPFTLN